MPGVRPYGFWVGDNAELFAQYVLSNFAFTTSILRQDDVGCDFYCVLSEKEGNLLKAGPFFTVQVKNKDEDIIYEKKHEVAWIKGQKNPFFICVSDTENMTVTLYSTWNRIFSVLIGGPPKRVLCFAPVDKKYPNPSVTEKEHRIPLGKPILKVSLQEVLGADDDKMKELKDVLKKWIEIDRENIAYSQTGMYWVVGPNEYETNVLPSMNTRMTYFVWNPRNLEKCKVNFGRAATALRIVTRDAIEAGHPVHSREKQRLDSLNDVLRQYWDELDPLQKKVLHEEIGLP